LICILSFDLATKMADRLSRFKVLIVDESHYLKSADSKRTQAITPLIKKAKRVLLLSGTPALSRPIELFTQLHSLLPDTFRTASSFGRRYCNGFEGAYGWDFTGSSNLPELHWLMEETCLIRRLKKDVLTELPAKIRQQVLLEPLEKYKKEFIGAKKKQSELDMKIKSSSGNTKQSLENARRVLTVQMYQDTGRAKIAAALAYLDELNAKGVKALLFAHHRDILDQMMLHLAKRKLKSIRIDGETPVGTRQDLCTQFQTDPKTRFAVLSITAAGVGLTLHAAQTVVFFELFWNPGQLLQAEDRAHRMGQKHVVDVKYLICRGTVDDTIWALIQRKIAVVGQSVNGSTDKMALAPTEQEKLKQQQQLEFQQRQEEEVQHENTIDQYMAAVWNTDATSSTFQPPDSEDGPATEVASKRRRIDVGGDGEAGAGGGGGSRIAPLPAVSAKHNAHTFNPPHTHTRTLPLATTAATPPSSFDAACQQLLAMGFANREANLHALKARNGNVEAALNDLLGLSSSASAAAAADVVVATRQSPDVAAVGAGASADSHLQPPPSVLSASEVGVRSNGAGTTTACPTCGDQVPSSLYQTHSAKCLEDMMACF
jgi:hypothetical protein